MHAPAVKHYVLSRLKVKLDLNLQRLITFSMVHVFEFS